MTDGLPRRARMALVGAGVCLALLFVVWYVAHYVTVVKRADVSILLGFAELHRPHLDAVTLFVAHLCDPHTYVVLAGIPVVVALLRGRPRVAIAVGAIMLAANETTQLLKPLLAAPRDPVWWIPIPNGSWPSGHATASMSLALCTVIAVPARRRPVVAALMTAFALAVCYSFLELGWHYPSDVLGGYLVAMGWTLLGVAGLSVVEARRPSRGALRAAPRPSLSVAEALIPAGVLLCAAAVFGGLIVLARPHEVIDYARIHETFVIGAAAIAVLGLAVASGLMLLLRRGETKGPSGNY
jgi:membrane-associated phospholipid phosphatase